ncbi:GNAT family N-acetyltransferase [Bifidobacterium sp. 82T24]|uniref:GNAT family N-acetyltransferase n=1 Tax=Bifidobacterium pluvialisilvae TaxID=2834436 RepID=UPI001C594806|nr:GNAT family N-acetyltransferase [Bifidobacterium pluvialisilvae]MBW3088008.1 GNAT family N-acetyltransferase [Bifidobacterium pluvialisilvae]
MREIEPDELNRLMPCLRALAEHHNAVSAEFGGSFPWTPFEKTLSGFAASIADGGSLCAVEEDERDVIGFCKIDFDGTRGYIDYLVVLAEYRGRGVGGRLMRWAIDTLKAHGADVIDLKVVYGNDAVRFYERYGFSVSCLEMRRNG